MPRSNSLTLSSPPSPILRRAYSNIGERKLSADCGTMFSDRDHMASYDLGTRVEVNSFIRNHINKINELSHFLEKNDCVSKDNVAAGDKFNVFQSIKFIPKYTRNRLENVRLEKSKKELVALIKLEYKKYDEKFREGEDYEDIDLEKIRLIDRHKMESILNIFVKINEKIKDIETRPSLMEVISGLLDAIAPLLGAMVGYTAASAPWVSVFLFSIVCLHYLLKFFVSFKRTFSYEGSEKDKHNKWIASIRKDYMPSAQEELTALYLKNKLGEGAEQIKFAQRHAESVLAFMENSSSVHTSSRPSSPGIMKPEWSRRRYHSSPSANFSARQPEDLDNEMPYPVSRPSSRTEHYGTVRRRCASSPSINVPGKQPEGLDNKAPIAQPQPRLQLPAVLHWNDFDDVYSVAGPSFSKKDFTSLEESSVERPKKRLHSSLIPEQSSRPQDGGPRDKRKLA